MFASLMGIATILHWDKFHPHATAFWLWAFLYFTTPFLIVWVFAVQPARPNPRSRDDETPDLGPRVRPGGRRGRQRSRW